MSHPLLDEYKQYKNIVGDSSQNDRIDSVLYSVTDFLKTGFGIAVVQEIGLNETLSVKSNMIVLKYLPINITALTINKKSWDLTDIYTEGNVVKGINTPLPNGKRNATITYDIGYLVDSNNNDIPFDLRMAVYILTAKLLENADSSGESIDYMSDPVGGRFKLLKAIPTEFYMLIAPYRAYQV